MKERGRGIRAKVDGTQKQKEERRACLLGRWEGLSTGTREPAEARCPLQPEPCGKEGKAPGEGQFPFLWGC